MEINDFKLLPHGSSIIVQSGVDDGGEKQFHDSEHQEGVDGRHRVRISHRCGPQRVHGTRLSPRGPLVPHQLRAGVYVIKLFSWSLTPTQNKLEWKARHVFFWLV